MTLFEIEERLHLVTRCLTAEDYDDRLAAREELRAMMRNTPSQPATGMEAVEYELRRILQELGIPAHLDGRDYLAAAIKLAAEKPELLESMGGKLYPETAAVCGSTAKRVERAIRHAIDVGWTRCDMDTVCRYFGSTISPSKGKPTSWELIASISGLLRHYVQ